LLWETPRSNLLDDSQITELIQEENQMIRPGTENAVHPVQDKSKLMK